MATAMATTAQTADSMPLEMPDSTTVAGPVLPDSAMSLTGLNWLEVKYCVMRLATWPSTTPTMIARNMRRPTPRDRCDPSGSPT